MEKIPFDIKYRSEIESGKYLVITREGYSVRIICWEYDPRTPIIATVEGKSIGKFYQTNGRLGGLLEGEEHSLDLFLVSNPDYKESIITCNTSEPSEATVWSAMAALGAKFTNYEGWYQCKVTFSMHEKLKDLTKIWDRGKTPYEAALGVYKQLIEEKK